MFIATPCPEVVAFYFFLFFLFSHIMQYCFLVHSKEKIRGSLVKSWVASCLVLLLAVYTNSLPQHATDGKNPTASSVVCKHLAPIDKADVMKIIPHRSTDLLM